MTHAMAGKSVVSEQHLNSREAKTHCHLRRRFARRWTYVLPLEGANSASTQIEPKKIPSVFCRKKPRIRPRYGARH